MLSGKKDERNERWPFKYEIIKNDNEYIELSNEIIDSRINKFLKKILKVNPNERLNSEEALIELEKLEKRTHD